MEEEEGLNTPGCSEVNCLRISERSYRVSIQREYREITQGEKAVNCLRSSERSDRVTLQRECREMTCEKK